jgi:hypothetical protein
MTFESRCALKPYAISLVLCWVITRRSPLFTGFADRCWETGILFLNGRVYTLGKTYVRPSS